MASINYAFKEISCKIVYYGPGLCGKTTNLQSIHASVPPKFRGDLVSLATEQDRTLFFDFLPLDLGEVRGFKTKFQLYTVPGQVYYNATRRLVLRGVDGVVFVADSAPDRMEENRESIMNLRENLESYGLELDDMPWVVQHNKRDLPNAVPLDEMEALLNPERVPSFEAVAVKGTGVKETLKGIAAQVLRRLREMAETGTGASSLEQKAASGEYQVARSQKVSLASPTPTPKETAPARPPEPAAAAPAPARPAPLPPKKPMPPPARSEATVPDLHVLQRCDLHWRGIKVGSAVVEISRRANVDHKAPYAMTFEGTCLGVFRTAWSCLLQWKGEEAKVVDYRKVPFYAFSEVAVEGKEIRGVRVWVKNGFDKACYVSYSALAGAIRLTPAGREWIG